MVVLKEPGQLLLLVHLLVPCFCSLQQGYSRIQHGHRLGGHVINSFPDFSFVDCVKECLITVRCLSVNYHRGANFCEINYEDKLSAESMYVVSSGWIYSEITDWPKDSFDVCDASNCSINQKCEENVYSETVSSRCVLSDCGLPYIPGLDLSENDDGDAIGLYRRIHGRCMDGYTRLGSGRLVCQPNARWNYDILCANNEWLNNRYKDHIYFLYTNTLTWEDAKTHCGSQLAYLTEIESEEENTWISNNIIGTHISSFEPGAWIGGTDKLIEGRFIWSESGADFTYTKWLLMNPDDRNGEDCVEMVYGGNWNDLSCDDKRMFLCEQNLRQ